MAQDGVEMRRQVTLLCSGICALYCRMAMARRTMFQRGDVQNKPSGLWGMLKSVTASAPGSESILYLLLDSSSPLCTRDRVKSNAELVSSQVPDCIRVTQHWA